MNTRFRQEMIQLRRAELANPKPAASSRRTKAIYFPIVEEPDLERRFDDSHRRYKAKVPCQIPQWRPWSQP
ncbi:MAG: hypothetical protein OXL68_04820 [Paracoccaceae bacterium]|nr:hypothetical protein [Paracoccaceae bacterium]